MGRILSRRGNRRSWPGLSSDPSYPAPHPASASDRTMRKMLATLNAMMKAQAKWKGPRHT